MPLNQDLSFNQVSAAHREAFRGKQEPRKILLKSGCRLYKFTDYGLEKLGDDNLTPWWFLVEPREAADPGFAGLHRQAATLGCTPQQVARSRAAVPNKGNGLKKLLQARLETPAWAFYGQCAYQPYEEYAKEGQKRSQAKVAYIGGAWQVYIPGLKKGDVKEV